VHNRRYPEGSTAAI